QKPDTEQLAVYGTQNLFCHNFSSSHTKMWSQSAFSQAPLLHILIQYKFLTIKSSLADLYCYKEKSATNFFIAPLLLQVVSLSPIILLVNTFFKYLSKLDLYYYIRVYCIILALISVYGKELFYDKDSIMR
ncbi:MAG: hypothetical protein K2H31_11910, partial [Lachnospiraceae bacterium]|nr:hypothetical protein [Lachnospiraceae bacterium]